MKKIGGNIYATVQVKNTDEVNKLHEHVQVWEDRMTLKGWLDFANGDSKHEDYDAKIQESTHYFLCDYVELPGITSENCRLVIDGQVYEVLVIDNPMELNYHLEWYLKYIGGQEDVS